jgi:probable phosphoglycerate mutase
LFYNKYNHIHFDKIYISKLKRTRQSVQAFIDNDIAVEEYAGLNEISWGVMDGKMAGDQDSTVYWNMVNDWLNGNVDAKIPTGESPRDVQNRLIPVMDLILQRTQEENILVCMHGRAMRILLATLMNKNLKQMDEFEHTNLCLYLLKYENSAFEIIQSNNTEHLL